jgi:hypothetical protein
MPNIAAIIGDIVATIIPELRPTVIVATASIKLTSDPVTNWLNGRVAHWAATSNAMKIAVRAIQTMSFRDVLVVFSLIFFIPLLFLLQYTTIS